jgi:hypothetical protein
MNCESIYYWLSILTFAPRSTDGRVWTVEMLQETTLREAIALVLEAIPAAADDDGAVEGYAGAAEWRLRRYRCAVATVTTRML